jgi:uncharacterized protein (DUF362 family)
MDRRSFLQLAAAPALLGADEKSGLEAPAYKVVSRHSATRSSVPGPYPGVVAQVHSDKVIDIPSGHVDQSTVDKMLSAGMQSLTGAKAEREAWASFFSPADVVGIKVNCSGAPIICSSPEVAHGIVRNLTAVGVKPDNIYIYERYQTQLISVHYDRYVPKGVHIVAVEKSRGSLEGYDPETYIEVSFFGEENTRSNLIRLVAEQFTKIINVPNAKEHQAAGVTGCLKNAAYGNFSNVARSHKVEKTNTLTFIGALAAVEPLRSKSVLNIMDGIRGIWHGGPFAEDPKYRFYPKMMMFSTDPVAMDRLLLELIEDKRKTEGAPSLWDRSVTIDKKAHLDFHKNTFVREPGYIEYAAAKFGLGEYDKNRIKLSTAEV